MRYEVQVICAFCGNEVRRYTTTTKPPGNTKLEAHDECTAIALAETDMAYAQDALHGRTLELN